MPFGIIAGHRDGDVRCWRSGRRVSPRQPRNRAEHLGEGEGLLVATVNREVDDVDGAVAGERRIQRDGSHEYPAPMKTRTPGASSTANVFASKS